MTASKLLKSQGADSVRSQYRKLKNEPPVNATKQLFLWEQIMEGMPHLKNGELALPRNHTKDVYETKKGQNMTPSGRDESNAVFDERTEKPKDRSFKISPWTTSAENNV